MWENETMRWSNETNEMYDKMEFLVTVTTRSYNMTPI